ncbi:hypothetical protein GCM10027567_07710 [Spongiibacter taiwanensis]
MGAALDFEIQLLDELNSIVDRVVVTADLKGIGPGGNAHAQSLLDQLEVFVELAAQVSQKLAVVGLEGQDALCCLSLRSQWITNRQDCGVSLG